MASSSSKSSVASTATKSSDQDDDHTPLKKYVSYLEGRSKAGGNAKWRCECCKITFQGSYFRVKAYLLKISGQGIRVCAKVDEARRREFQREVDEAEQRLQRAMPKKVPLPSTQDSVGQMQRTGTSGGARILEGFESKKRKPGPLSQIEKAFNSEARLRLHREIARMIYSGGLPFHIVRNPYFISAFTYAANTQLTGYVPPGYNMLRTSLLQEERMHIERLLEPFKSSWNEKGLTLVSDGWSDPQRRPLINFMAVTKSGPMFLKAVNCEGDVKDKYFIRDEISKVIMEVGPMNVVQVITDNAPVCRAAGHLIEGIFPHIFWTLCVVHTLNLALKNICAAKNTEANNETYEECKWITEISGDALIIKNFIMTHSMRLSMFNDFSNLKFLSIAETRFASVIVMLKRFVQIKHALQKMVISEHWSSYREDDVDKAKFVKEKVLDDLWWEKVEYILSFSEAIYEMLRFADTDKPSLHLVYDMWDSMIEKVRTSIYRHERRPESEVSSFYNVIHNILVDRWNKSNTPLHCLAHSLNPRYYTPDWLGEGTNRVAPHRDSEISEEINKCLKRYFPDPAARRAVNVEFVRFSAAIGEFADSDCLADRFAMDLEIWWVVYGSSIPNLQSLALKLLGQPCSSSCCERNWSTYSFIHSMRRNKLKPQRADDLVFVHSNLRLLSRTTPEYTDGASKLWDIAGDAHDSLDETGILEIVDLSLDEPELEAMIFVDEEVYNDIEEDIHEFENIG